jgi:hypothetical protein
MGHTCTQTVANTKVCLLSETYCLGVTACVFMYAGSWMNGLRSGKGEYRDTDGNVYTGEFMNGKCHGPG